ncbi:MAG TPA: hypothetical protein VJO52_16415 [Gemmatimonadaceae bacterium]|nr:hypothetical protein [Gemmatimonadaceae bacterium]
MMRKYLCLLVLAAAAATLNAQARQAPSRAALDDIVGVWQSDTVGGVSARSVCSPSPLGAAVICEQLVSSARGIQRALNFFVVDSAAGRYAHYVLGASRDLSPPTPVAIAKHVWTYGGHERSSDGNYYRTINDFSPHDSYTWRQESSRDGVHWAVIRHGRSIRERSSTASRG